MAKTNDVDYSKELYDYIKGIDLSKPGNKPKLLKRIKSTITKVKKTQTKQNKAKAKKKLSPLQKAYREYFQDMLKKYKVDSPAQIKPVDKKNQFFTNIKKWWVNGEGPKKEDWYDKVVISEGKMRNIYNEVRIRNKSGIELSVINENKLRKYIRGLIGNINESKITANFSVGDEVTLTTDALETYGKKYEGQIFKITDISTSIDDHPGFDDIGEALYDLRGFDNSVYDYEIEEA